MSLPEQKWFFLAFLTCLSSICNAQICTGSLGDPVVNVHFGSSTSGNTVPVRLRNYNYTAQECPDDGNFTIVDGTFNCFSSTWHNVPEDHTAGDAAGKMMLVNASFDPGDFYLDTVVGLCPDITYEFAAWILNVLKPSACGFAGIRPNLSFQITTVTGSVLGSYNTGDIEHSPVPDWKQFGIYFTTPAGVDRVILRLTNNAPGGCGNDLILDDITFRPCGPAVSAAINVNGSTSSIDVCEDDTRSFDLKGALSSGYRNAVLQWQLSVDSVAWVDIPGAQANDYHRTPTAPGRYHYRLSVAEEGNINAPSCRIASNVLTIFGAKRPVLNASVSEPVCVGGPLALHAEGGTIYAWRGPNGFSSSEAEPLSTATMEASGRYYITASSIPGCARSDSVMVEVHARPPVNAGSDQTACEGIAVQLDAATTLNVAWSPAEGLSSAIIPSPVANLSDTTTFNLTVTDVNGCSNSDDVTINILKKPVANAGADQTIFEGSSTSLSGSAAGTGIHYFWTPPTSMDNSTLLIPSVFPADDISYTLHVVSDVGCGTAQDQVFVRVLKKVIIPNAFSPNGDGINDVWKIVHLETYPEANLTVFNRHGKSVFTSRGYARPWDGNYQGSPLPAGTYYYVVDLKNDIPKMSGWVFVVR